MDIYIIENWQFLVSAVLGLVALALAVMSHLSTKRIRQEFDGSLGTPAVQIRWDNPTKEGLLPCRVTAEFNRVSRVSLRVGREEKTVDHLERGEWKDIEFQSVTEGTKFKLSFIDPVERRSYSRNGIVRYGQIDL